MACDLVDLLLAARQKVDEKRSQPGITKHSGDEPVARTEPATAAAVREENDSRRRWRNTKRSFQRDGSDRDRNRSLELVIIVCGHGSSPPIVCEKFSIQEDHAWTTAIWSHESAHRRQLCAHACITSSSTKRSQSSAQRWQTAAQTAQIRPCSSEPRSMKSAAAWQIVAQSRSSVMCASSACAPACSRQ